MSNDSDKLLVDGQMVIVSGVGFEVSPNNPIFNYNYMQTAGDDGSTRTIRTQGPRQRLRG